MARCYDPGRMSSAPARSAAPPGRVASLWRVLRGVAWTVVLAVLAVAAAGLIGGTWHAPGSPARAELTYIGDAALDPRLDAATAQLGVIAALVDELTQEAKTALGEVASSDPSRLREALEEGGLAAAAIARATRDLRDSLVGLPGDGPAAAIDFNNATLVRRAAVLAAIDAAASLAAQWQQVNGRAADAAHLISVIDGHDQTVLAAAAQGRASAFAEAEAIVGDALLVVAEVQALRVRLIAGSDRTVLDEWIERNAAYDVALRALYAALVKSKGDPGTVEVQSARREERLAFAQLPPDRRTIVVIVAEVARGGLTQAVLAIEEALSRIEDALAEAG